MNPLRGVVGVCAVGHCHLISPLTSTERYLSVGVSKCVACIKQPKLSRLMRSQANFSVPFSCLFVCRGERVRAALWEPEGTPVCREHEGQRSARQGKT